MYIRVFLLLSLFFCTRIAHPSSLTLAEKICSSYTNVNTVSCQVSKVIKAETLSSRLLSRIYYQRPDCLHVENISPLKRRILSDGTNFYSALPEKKKVYTTALTNLPPTMKVMQESIPGSPLEYLLPLQGLPEDILESLPDQPVRRGYQTDKLYIVLATDNSNRLTQIAFYQDNTLKERTALVTYDKFIRVTDNCWLSSFQRLETKLQDSKLDETRHFSNVEVNQPLADGLFNPANFFKEMEIIRELPFSE